MATKTNKTAFSAAWIRVEDDKSYREVSWEHSSIYDTGTRARQRKLPMKFFMLSEARSNYKSCFWA